MAVINQIIRGLQVESGYGLRHVAMFTAWTEQFYATGLGGWPHQLLGDIAEVWGERWWHLVEHLDELRERLGSRLPLPVRGGHGRAANDHGCDRQPGEAGALTRR